MRPLTPIEDAIWIESQRTTASRAYHVPYLLRVSGELDPDALAAALRDLVAAHEALRTGFSRHDGRAVAVVHDEASPRLHVLDGTDSAELLAELTGEPFDLAAPPLLRAALVRQGAGSGLLCLVLHHLVTDGRSREILFTELVRRYLTHAGLAAAEPERPVHSYTRWAGQRVAALAAGELDEHRRFWAGRFDEASGCSLGRLVGGSAHDYRGERITRTVRGPELVALRRSAARQRATMSATLLAAWAATVGRFAGTRTVPVGVISDGRDAGNADVVGPLAGTVPVVLPVDPAAGFAECVGAAGAALRDVLGRPVLPPHTLGDDGAVPPGWRRALDVQFVHTHAPTAQTVGDVTLTPLESTPDTAKAPLLLTAVERRGELVLGLDYGTELFGREAADGLLDAVHDLLANGSARPDEPLWTLDPAPEAAPPARGAGQAPSLAVLFADVVRRFPDVTAVSDPDSRWSYRELGDRVVAVAGGLRELGVRRGSAVGVCMSRSVDMVAVLLGVLWAGAAYVPLDPAYPARRLRSMVADAGVSVVVGTGDFGDVPVVPPAGLAGEPVDVVDVTGDDAAYVIFTSGSTGRPKGVRVSHGNVLGLLESARTALAFDHHDVWSMFHSFAFDFSVWEIWGALGFGGRLVVVPKDVTRSPDEFAALLARERVTMLSQTPSAFGQLAPLLAAGTALRTVVFGGERLDTAAVRRWREHPGTDGLRLVNMYGITETTVHVTVHELGDAKVDSPIGSALPGVEVRVLDGFGQPVPPGLVGEVFVSGWGVAQGYVGRPGLTAERFVPDPWRKGGRMYRSGDLARVLPGGGLEYVGRADAQVNLHGFRIELGEIEHALRAHPRVEGCAVLLTGQRLVGYLVPAGPPPSAAELRDFLAGSLAEHMVPGVFVPLAELPVTPNGKLDRAALPVPDGLRPELTGAYTAPRTQLEHTLATVWAGVLGVDRVGVHDNFFELGGDSIRAVQVIGELDRHGRTASVGDFFTSPTVAGLAELVADNEPVPLPRPFELLAEGERERLPAELVDAYPMTATQVGMYLQARLNPDSRIYHNVNSFEVRGAIDPAAFTLAARAAVRRYPVLRTGFRVDGLRTPLQLVYPEAPLEVEYRDLSEYPAAEQDELIGTVVARESATPFDLARPPLIRFRLLRRGADHLQVVVAESHLILDGWSFTSLLTEICTDHWAVGRTGTVPSRPPLRSSFAQFVRLETEATGSGAARDFWRAELERAVPSRVAELAEQPDAPLDIGRRIVPIPAELERSLRALAARLRVPLKSVLLAAHLRVLAALLGRRDVVSGVVTGGRPEGLDGDRVKGLFLNTVPVATRLGGQTWAGLAAELYERERALLPYRRYPLNQMLRDRHVKELFDVAFHFVEFHELKKLFGDDLLAGVEADGRSEENTHFRLLAAFSVHPPANRLGLVLVHDRPTLGQRIDGLAEAYLHALHALAGTPDEPHATFRLPAATAPAVIGPRPPAEHVSLTDLLADAVRRYPDAVALSDMDTRWSYRELGERVAAVAGALRERGVGRGSRVGVSLDRSPELVAVLLGVLWTGAAYVPLDPAYPLRRLHFMAADAGVSLVLGDGSFGELPVLPVERALAGEPVGPAAPGADDPAYVIYTSGSTGQPKGVQVSHGNVLGLLDAARSVLRFDRWDTWSLFHSFAFDVSVWEIWGALGSGGRLVVVPKDVARSPETFAALLERERVTVLSQTPSAFARLAPHLPAGALVRLVVFAGERLDMAAVRAWRREPGCGSARFVNMYGITETTVHVTVHEVGDGEDGSPVGVGLPGAEVRVLDGFGQPVPPGVTGEIAVSGWGVAHGYVGRPGLTAERFVPDPWCRGGRMYRSGDLARVLPGGGLEYVGRADAQVKVRGFRIELGEIEHALRAHPDVAACAVTAAGERLVGYVVPAPGGMPQVGQLRDFLAESLAEHMIPGSFVQLPDLPLTPNGKLDRAALPAPGRERPELAAEYTPPGTEAERALAEVWSQVLDVDRVGIHDNFFELGGNSMSAVEVAAEAGEVGLPVDLVDVYEHPTVHRLAEHLRSRAPSETEARGVNA